MLEQMLKETVQRYPENTALIYDALRFTYHDLYALVNRVRRGFQSIGIQQGDCIALLLPNCPEFITSFYAAAQLKAIILPLNPALAAEEIKYYINDSNAVVIITDRQHADLCTTVMSKLGRKVSMLVTDGEHPAGIYMQDLAEGTRNTIQKHRSPYVGTVLFQYSSGSTGRPKRVGKTQKNLFHEAYNFTTTIPIAASDNFLCAVPLFHAHGFGNCMLAATRTGATMTILEELKKNGVTLNVPFALKSRRVMELIERERVTILPGVPFVFKALSEIPDNLSFDVSSLRICFSAGNFLQKETFDKFLKRFGIAVRQLYGCTEAGSVAINLEPGNAIKYDSVGFPMKNGEVIIVDDQGTILPPGAIGEITIKSLALTSGYCNMPELNATAFKDGYFRTGDLGKKDEQGYIFITGRKKIFIETGGNKVDPLEIEDILMTHPKVKEAVVVGVKGAYDQEIIKAVIVSDGDCQVRDITSYCKDRLASFKVPQLIEFRDEIPKNPLGKILRKDLV